MITLISVANVTFSNLWQRVTELFSTFDWIDLIDIILLAAILFCSYRFLKGRKATALLVGILVCVFTMFVSWVFGLEALYTVFRSIISSGPLVIIVIFQTEIREALEKIGSGSISGLMSFSDRRKKKELYNNVIENICTSVKEMALECTGALIVIERTIRLTDIIDGGVKINADVNSLLIRNLFFNKAPLHDGAVVVSDGRIAAAACFLPLTRSTDIDSDLGTRHRAALGMTESSDAIVIVVSEETGTISVACERVLQRNLTPDELRKYLSENLLKSSLTNSDN